jgi:hypothetical protein
MFTDDHNDWLSLNHEYYKLLPFKTRVIMIISDRNLYGRHYNMVIGAA